MRKKDIAKELKSHATVLPAFGTALGILYAATDKKSIINGAKIGFEKGINPVFELLKEYLSTSDYHLIQKNRNLKLKILNKKYLMESVSDTVRSDRYLSTSLRHIRDGLEVSLQFAGTKIIKIELAKKDEGYTPTKAMYGTYTLYIRS